MAEQYSKEFKDRALRLLSDHLAANPDSGKWAGIQTVARSLGISPYTLNGWMKQVVKQGESAQAAPIDLSAENARLRRENMELRRANEIVKAASAFSQPSSIDPARNDPLHHYS